MSTSIVAHDRHVVNNMTLASSDQPAKKLAAFGLIFSASARACSSPTSLSRTFRTRARRACLAPSGNEGTFTQDLYDEAKKDGWVVISMKKDWKRIFGFDKAP